MNTRQVAALVICLAQLPACRERRAARKSELVPKSSASSSILPPEAAPEPRHGMVWIPRGPLVAGTPEGSLPRIADEEMRGEQIILKPYYIDVFPYPNEEGAIPLTNLTREAALGLCAESGKRLCSELEWERACKGPDNHRFEYGESYRPERCGTGAVPVPRPTGMRTACGSDFGVRDLHGGAWEWTASDWARGSASGFASLRGGNAADGEIVARCANARAQKPTVASAAVGFRCCAGPPNSAAVELDIERGPALELVARIDKSQSVRIVEGLPDQARAALSDRSPMGADRQWLWRPIGNEQLYLTRVCAGLGQRPACGIAVSRIALGQPTLIAWAFSRHWLPSVEVDRDPHEVWMLGGDATGTFQRSIQYRFGRVVVSEEEHRVREPKSQQRKKGKGR